tara:strand:+ start:1450 stop:2232 length:783 start_codon:yes stop_codon:yes gene_type:complete
MDLGNAPSLGHNEPPLDAEPIKDRLTEDHADLLKRRQELVDAQERVPACDTPEAAAKIGDYIKQLSSCMKDADGRRVKEKEPYLEGGRRVDGFFKDVKESLEKIKAKCGKALTEYQKEVARQERIALAAKAEADAKAAKEAEEEAARKLEVATADAHLEEAVEAEETAIEAADEAAKSQKAADQSAADLSRTRSTNGGSVSSLHTIWTFRDLDRETIDLEALRPYLTKADIEKALRAYIKTGAREIKGAVIFEDQVSRVR